MPSPISRPVAVVLVLNVLLGTLAAISCVFNFTFFVLEAVAEPRTCLIDGSLAALGAVLGLASGLSLRKGRPAGRWLSLAFAVELVAFVAYLGWDGRFNGASEALLGAYGVLLALVALVPGWMPWPGSRLANRSGHEPS